MSQNFDNTNSRTQSGQQQKRFIPKPGDFSKLGDKKNVLDVEGAKLRKDLAKINSRKVKNFDHKEDA